jgi:FeS assembly SUF system protein
MDSNKIVEEQIIMTLRSIYDPEIPVSIYDLGLIYDIDLSPLAEDKWETSMPMFDVHISMTLTAPNCPVAESLPVDVEERVAQIGNINKCTVKITFEPPWTKDCMSEEAMLELGML